MKNLVVSLCSIALASSIPVSAQIYEQARQGGGTQTNNADFNFPGSAFSTSANKSTAAGQPAGSTSSRFIVTPATTSATFTLSPNRLSTQLVNGTTYAVAITFPTSGSTGQKESTDIVATTSDTGTTGNDTFAGSTTAFQQANGVNTWVTIGNVIVNSANPTFTFTWQSGANVDRWYMDTVRFTALPAGPTAQYWDTGSPGGSGTWDTTTQNWNTLSDGTGTQGAFTPAEVAVFGGTAGTVSIDPVNGVTTDGGLEFDTSGYIVQSGQLNLGYGTNIAVVGSTSIAVINSVIAGTNGLCTAGVGTLLLNTNESLFGTVTLNAGTLSLGTNQTFDSLGGISAGKLSLLTNTLTISGTNNTTCASAIADSGPSTPGYLIKQGTNTQALTGTSTYNGATTIAGGALTIAADANLGAAPSTPVANQIILSNAARLDFSANASLSVNRGITLGPGDGLLSTPGTGVTPTIAGTISGAGNLIIPTGGFDLTGTNTFTGNLYLVGTNVDAAANGLSSVRFDSTAAAGAGKIFMMPGNGKNITLRTFTYTNSVVTNAVELDPFPASGLYLSGAIASAGKLCTLTLSGNINGTGQANIGLTPSGGSSNPGGTVALSGSNSAWSGGSILAYGNLAVGSSNALGTGLVNIGPTDSGSTLVLMSTIPLTGASAVTNPITINVPSATFVLGGASDLELSGPVKLVTSTTLTVTNTGTNILSGPIGDLTPGSLFSLTMAGTNTLTLRGANSYDGGTIVNSGTLIGQTAGSIPGDATINIGGTLQLDTAQAMPFGSTLTVNGGGVVNLNFTGYQTNAALIVGGVPQTNGIYNSSSPAMSGILTGSGNVVVSPGFSIVSESVLSGTNGVVCWQSVPGHNYDVLTNAYVAAPLASWTAANLTAIAATNATTCYTLTNSLGTTNLFLLIRKNN